MRIQHAKADVLTIDSGGVTVLDDVIALTATSALSLSAHAAATMTLAHASG